MNSAANAKPSRPANLVTRAHGADCRCADCTWGAPPACSCGRPDCLVCVVESLTRKPA